MTDEEYRYLTRALLRLTGINLGGYKTPQMRRRLDGYISSRQVSVTEFCHSLANDPGALATLRSFLTINVSEFFRDPDQFTLLKTSILPKLLKKWGRLRIWSAGCSHGAEAYSVALMLEELSPRGHHKIVATDIDRQILERAKQGGPYPESEMKNVSAVHLKKYFDKTDQGYLASKDLRARVDFLRHDLLKDRPQENMELIICRNVVIYFNENAKKLLNQRLVSALKDGGVLFIGGTEALLDARELGLIRIFPAFYKKLGKLERETESRRQAKVPALSNV